MSAAPVMTAPTRSKKEFHDDFEEDRAAGCKQSEKAEADHFISDCPMAAEQIAQGLENHDAQHPMGLLRKAYGI